MKLYDELAEWWPLFSAPADYAEEAAFFARVLTEACQPAPRTVLELGSGGGNNAFHLKSKFEMTLVDLSPQMLAVSRALNPECQHREGDMRTVNLGRTLDAVFIHDAIAYMTSEDDLHAAIRAAYRHCRAGGVALFVPDCVRETFVAETRHGGHDGDDGRSLRYLMWTVDPDPTDTTYRTDFAIMLRDRRDDTRVVHDSHVEGLFPRAQWMRMLREAGFEPRTLIDDWKREIFLAKRPSSLT
ncbi:MAG: class I SAM-dependent methyltransferase [Candidatus Binatus sp.]